MSNRPGLAPTPPLAISCNRPRILLADDHALFTQGLAKILEPEFEIAGIVVNGRLLLQEAPGLCPDVILLDLAMPLMNGSEAGHRLNAMLPRVRIIVLTASEDAALAAAALRGWASGYVLKKALAEDLIQAVRQVLQGKKYVSPDLRRKLQDEFVRNNLRCSDRELTARQREVLQLFAEGYSMKEIANILSLATCTIAFHKYKMMKDLGVKTNADLLRLAIRERLMQP